ncbi:hypothetical protein DL93DRAFT_1944301 [Clavulina sp. PMI_390]|nr:hypothetical protein DL93DRAFT_1944301 [Clavulina sp. PMI_390]
MSDPPFLCSTTLSKGATRMMLIAFLSAFLFLSFQASALLTVTGTANNTVLIIPVDDIVARSLIPGNYSLLPVDSSILPNFPSGQHPLVLVLGQDFNITLSLDLLVFSQARLHIPFVDHLSDGKTSFSYVPDVLVDSLAGFAAFPAGAGLISVLSVINPPMGTQNAVYVKDGFFKFDAVGVLGGYVHMSSVPASTESPWPLAAYSTLSNMPIFGALNPFCFQHIETIQASSTLVVANVSMGSPPVKGSPLAFSNIYGVMAVRSFSENLINPCEQYAT